jgi:MFS family permease
MASNAFYGWKLLAVFWVTVFVVLGFPAYGMGIMNTFMAQQMGFDRTVLGLLFTVFMVMSGLPAPLFAMLVNRKGVRFTIVTATLLLFAGSLAMATLVDSVWGAIFAASGVVGLAVAAGAGVPTQTGVMRWFVRRRALAMSVVVSAGGFGGFVAPPLINGMIESAGGDWRVGWWVFVVLAALCAVVAALFVREQPSDLGQHPDGIAPGATVEGGSAPKPRSVYLSTEEWTSQEALGSATFWMLLLCMCGMSLGYTWLLSHGFVHLQDLGHTRAAAASAASAFAIFTLAGKFTVGGLGDRIEPRYLFSIALALFAVGLFVVMNATTTISLYVYAVLLGIGWGAALTCLMTLLGNYFGTKAYAGVVGVTIAVQTTVSAVAPSVAGYLFERTGTYGPTVYTIAVLCVIGSFVLLLTKPPLRPVRARAIPEVNTLHGH